MFNYGEVDAFVTIRDLKIISVWAENLFPNDMMIKDIIRTKGDRVYDIHFTVAQHGFNRKIVIDDRDKVEIIERDREIFWMS